MTCWYIYIEIHVKYTVIFDSPAFTLCYILHFLRSSFVQSKTLHKAWMLYYKSTWPKQVSPTPDSVPVSPRPGVKLTVVDPVKAGHRCLPMTLQLNHSSLPSPHQEFLLQLVISIGTTDPHRDIHTTTSVLRNRRPRVSEVNFLIM